MYFCSVHSNKDIKVDKTYWIILTVRFVLHSFVLEMVCFCPILSHSVNITIIATALRPISRLKCFQFYSEFRHIFASLFIFDFNCKVRVLDTMGDYFFETDRLIVFENMLQAALAFFATNLCF